MQPVTSSNSKPNRNTLFWVIHATLLSTLIPPALISAREHDDYFLDNVISVHTVSHRADQAHVRNSPLFVYKKENEYIDPAWDPSIFQNDKLHVMDKYTDRITFQYTVQDIVTSVHGTEADPFPQPKAFSDDQRLAIVVDEFKHDSKEKKALFTIRCKCTSPNFSTNVHVIVLNHGLDLDEQIHFGWTKVCGGGDHPLVDVGIYDSIMARGGVALSQTPRILNNVASDPFAINDMIPYNYILLSLREGAYHQAFGPPVATASNASALDLLVVGSNLGGSFTFMNPTAVFSTTKLVLFYKCRQIGKHFVTLTIPIPPFRDKHIFLKKDCSTKDKGQGNYVKITDQAQTELVTDGDFVSSKFHVSGQSISSLYSAMSDDHRVYKPADNRAVFDLSKYDPDGLYQGGPIKVSRVLLSYDRTLIQVKVIQPSVLVSNTTATGSISNMDWPMLDNVQTLELRFVCKNKARIGVVVSLLFGDGFPVNFGFIKECEKPHTKEHVYMTAGTLFNLFWLGFLIFIINMFQAFVKWRRGLLS